MVGFGVMLKLMMMEAAEVKLRLTGWGKVEGGDDDWREKLREYWWGRYELNSFSNLFYVTTKFWSAHSTAAVYTGVLMANWDLSSDCFNTNIEMALSMGPVTYDGSSHVSVLV